MAPERRFAEVREMLEDAGYEPVRVTGSHHIFIRAGRPLVSIPVHHGKVKAVYVRQVKNICQEDEGD